MKRLGREERLQLVKFACALAWADLEVSDAERLFIARVVRGLRLDPEEVSLVERWLERAQKLIKSTLVASVGETAAALRLVVERNRVIAESAGACPVACALAGRAGSGRIVCVVSGGNIDASKLCTVMRCPLDYSSAI